MYKKNNSVIVRKESEDVFTLYDSKTDTVFLVNDIGALIFKSVNDSSLEEVAKDVCNKTEDDVKSSLDTIKNYLLLLVKKGLIFYEE